MTPIPTRDTPAGRAYNDLRNLARRQHRDVAEYLTLYALEGLLARLAVSSQAGDYVLKGGVLMAAFADRRPTRDIDLSATGFPHDVAECEDRIRKIISTPVDDGLVFDTSSVRGEVIRDDADYTGVRVHLTARLTKARIALHADINFGDPIWPAPTPTDLPRLLGGTLRLLGYPDHMVIAEKTVTAIQRGIANTRWRDFVDISSIIHTRSIAASDLHEALTTVASHRHTTLRPLTEALVGMAETAQPKWAAWRRKQRLENTTPEKFQDLLDHCITFTDPVLNGTVDDQRWSPVEKDWIQPRLQQQS